MARHYFLGDMSAWATDLGTDEVSAGGLSGKHALFIPGASITFWTAQTGGSQITDLLDMLGTAITSVTADANGEFPQIQGPDTSPDTLVMWADGNGGAGPRRKVLATDIGDLVLSNLSSLLDLIDQVTTLQDQVANSLGVVVKDTATGTWPTRPAAATARPYMWIGDSAPPIGGSYAVAGRDIWFNPNPLAA